VRIFLNFTRERLINPWAKALLLTRAFKIKGYCAGRKNSADTIINLLFINLRYKGFVSNSIRSIYSTGSSSIDFCSRR
jgi:hypothetical protein